jgi:hypothetical protein
MNFLSAYSEDRGRIFFRTTRHHVLKIRYKAQHRRGNILYHRDKQRYKIQRSLFWCITLKVNKSAKRYVPPKGRLAFTGLHGVISQKIELFITTAVRTSNPTFSVLCLSLACHLLSRGFLALLILQPWRWRRYVSPKRRLISQKMVLFIITAVRTSYPTAYRFIW